MNINNFERNIDRTILDRGYNYFDEGSVIDVYNQGDNEYVFEVEGNEVYEVTVKIDEAGEILYSSCDCPYDFGPVCKHQVAAYFELFELINSNTSKKEVTKQPEINEVLNKLSKEELINIIVHITKADTTLRNSIIFKYSKGDDTRELEKCKKLMDSIVRKYTGREGFIGYREIYGFVSEMKGLLEKVEDTNNPLLALDIAFLVLEEAIEAFQYADDSNGEIGSLVSEIIDLIQEVMIEGRDLDINIRENIFNKLLIKSDSTVFDEWEEYRIDILSVCAEFADIEDFREKLRIKIKYFINKNSNDEYEKYSNESMLQILFDMIEKYGTEEDAEEFIKDNLKFTSFRELFINKCIKEKNYHKVIELALEGEKQDKEYAGLIAKWKKIRYTAYKELSLKKEQSKLAKELLFEGNFEYYRELKELVEEDKESFYSNLKQELKNYTGWHGRSIYLKLIEEENDLNEIMKFVRENPKNIEKYAEMLVDKFNDEVMEVYKEFIKSVASSSSNRREYQGVCRILKRYKKIAGKESQEEMIKELSILYRKRPAFVDELSKI
ncbi:hypothetical protein [uncultured Clostridium sp.]|uniref:SWIM zinc finger family protein n=1 Tax=uncultured Clostridium sp. TaxID=59620 RepID=UPI0032178CF2